MLIMTSDEGFQLECNVYPDIFCLVILFQHVWVGDLWWGLCTYASLYPGVDEHAGPWVRGQLD